MPGAVFVAIAIADSLRYADPDLWGHVAFGRAMLAAHHLITRDPYSYSAPGHRWLNHEWMSEVAMAAAFNALGVFGLKLMKLALSAATMAFLAMAEGETGAPESAQLAVMLGAAVMVAPYFQFRPQMFTFAMFAALIHVLARDCYSRRRGIWVVIPMLALWSNLHGGFIMGIAALGIYATVRGATDIARGDGAGRAILLGAIAIAATIATLCSPYGFGAWQVIGHALANPYTRVAMRDWQPMLRAASDAWATAPLGAMYDLAPIAFMAALAVSVAISRELDDLPMIAIAAVMSAAAFASVRNIPIAIIAMAPPLTRHVGVAAVRHGRASSTGTAPARRASRIGQIVLATAGIAMLAGTRLFSQRLSARESYPAGAIAFMESHRLGGNILASFRWGEYVIWHLAPDSKVFIDGRYDTVYPMGVIRAFMLFTFDAPGGGAILDAYPHDFVMISPASDAVKIMAARTDWKLVYRDAETMLYARADSRAAKIADVPAVGANPPASFP